MIYGVATLAACMLLGKLLGTVLGELTGIGSEIGGVGFAMLLLLFVTQSKYFPFTKKDAFKKGIAFWKSMFIPVVVAMSASQNVFSMLSGGLTALAAGAAAVGFSFLLVYLLHKHDERKGA